MPVIRLLIMKSGKRKAQGIGALKQPLPTAIMKIPVNPSICQTVKKFMSITICEPK